MSKANLREQLGFDPREEAPLTLADYESHEGERVQIVSSTDVRNGMRYTGNKDNVHAEYLDCTTQIKVDGTQVASYDSYRLPERWVLLSRPKVEELARGRASAEEMESGIDAIIANLAEQSLHALDDCEYTDEDPYEYMETTELLGKYRSRF